MFYRDSLGRTRIERSFPLPPVQLVLPDPISSKFLSR
jgi:hypothetical protein